jgi:heme exporter protein C
MTSFDRLLASYYKTKMNIAMISLAFLGVFAALVRIAWFTPIDAYQGIVQKIFYIHLPCAIVTFVAFFGVFIASIAFLKTRSAVVDDMALSLAEMGVFFCSLVLITGPIWAKPAWGAYWTWDTRLTTTLILWVLYVGYLLLRQLSIESERAKTVAAILGIVALIDVPIIKMSVTGWRSIHPTVLSGAPGKGLDPSMAQTLGISLGAFLFFFFIVFIERFALARTSTLIKRVRMSMEVF